MGIIRIRYGENGKDLPLEYERVELSLIKEEKNFDTGNFVEDWYDMRKFIIHHENESDFFWSHSSSVDHFIMDGAPYDSAYLHMVEGKPVLKYFDRSDPKWYLNQADVEEGIEFFVPENTQPTWEELRKLCNDEKK